MSIDVEGAEIHVLKSIDFRKIEVKVLLVEWRKAAKRSRADHMAQFGYKRVVLDSGIGHTQDELFWRPDLIEPGITGWMDSLCFGGDNDVSTDKIDIDPGEYDKLMKP
eukprot:UN17155